MFFCPSSQLRSRHVCFNPYTSIFSSIKRKFVDRVCTLYSTLYIYVMQRERGLVPFEIH